jgi:hypothetical protein
MVILVSNALGVPIGSLSEVASADRAHAALQWIHAMRPPARWAFETPVSFTISTLSPLIICLTGWHLEEDLATRQDACLELNKPARSPLVAILESIC